MVLIVVLAAAGLAVGPLVGVVVDRAVEREPLAVDHRCPSCDRSLGPRSPIPVLGWWAACPDHGRPWRYPLVDLGTAALFALAAWRIGPSWQLVPYLALFTALVALSAIDFETYLLPDILTIPTLALALALVAVASLTEPGRELAVPALVGLLFYGGFALVAHLLNPAGLGFGDVKLAPILGLCLGWLQASTLVSFRLVLYAILAGFLGGALIGTVANVALGRGLRAEIPFGPAMVAGMLVVFAAAPQLI